MKLILLMAQSMDGKVARTPNDPCDWTGKEDKKYFAMVTREAGVCIMGRKTFDIIGKPLPDRLNVVMTSAFFRKSISGKLEFVKPHPPEQILKTLKHFGYSTACLIGGPTVNTLFAKAGLIDEVHVTIVPRIFGSGMSMFAESLDIELAFQSRELFEDGGQVLKYKVVK